MTIATEKKKPGGPQLPADTKITVQLPTGAEVDAQGVLTIDGLATVRTLRAMLSSALAHPDNVGRPKSKSKRCACGRFTLKSAKANRHKCPPPSAI